jgi:hypothetical protein
MTVVREVAVAPALEAAAALHPVDYRESFTFSSEFSRTAEEWSRLALERAPLSARFQMITAWTLLGIRLAPPWTESQVLGWRMLHSTPETIVLEARAALGVTARLVFHVSGSDVTQAMLVRFDRYPGRPVWNWLAPRHRRFLRALLAGAASR